MKKLYLSLLLVSGLNVMAQQGGMWIPSLLEGQNENEMKALGSNLSAQDIYSVDKPSIKDAIVHFDGGCTAEIISKKSLLLTNHHCGYGAIQSHSTVEKDYLKDGFWAYKAKEELANPGMTASIIKRIDDVTDLVLAGVNKDMSPQEQDKIIQKNISQAQKNVKKEDWQTTKIKSFYKGNKYYLFVIEVFKDVRLVGAPPSSIGKFGSDTDNWVWPRHTGDFSMFRIYADKHNRPAEYSEDNCPYKPDHSLPISLDGVSDDDFTMVFGFPGRTNEYLPSVAVDQILKTLNPAKIELRDKALKIMDKHMRADSKIKIQYASKYASIANYWKKWIGENQGLIKSNAVANKAKLEKEFQNKVQNNSEYNSLLNDFEGQYKAISEVALARDYWVETVYRNVELLKATFKLTALEKAASKNEEAFNTKRNALLKDLSSFYKNYNATVDQEVFESLISLYAQKMPAKYLSNSLKAVDVASLTKDIYTNSSLTNLENLKTLLEGDSKTVIAKLNQDKAYVLGKDLVNTFFTKINPDFYAIQGKIELNQKTYMKALMETFPKERFFPDANSTLRVTYGKVKGYAPRDAVKYDSKTYLKGIMEKYIPQDYEFDVSPKLKDLYDTKDYGRYAEDGKMPVNFIGTNHTTGGNSGSPVLDADGNLIGLNFDRVWEGTMSDINYDPEICRNIMVDARYILFIVDKMAKNKRLIKEMKLVHPKKK